jgi:hypothetical protein
VGIGWPIARRGSAAGPDAVDQVRRATSLSDPAACMSLTLFWAFVATAVLVIGCVR